MSAIGRSEAAIFFGERMLPLGADVQSGILEK
jgi:hypothetical protein